MPINRPLLTDSDFQEAVDRKLPVRVFQDDHLVNSGATVVRFTDFDVVIQSRVSDLTYYSRKSCEFFEVRPKESRNAMISKIIAFRLSLTNIGYSFHT